LHHFIFHFHKCIITLSGILTLFAIILASQLKLDLNLLSLLPSENLSVRTFFEVSEDFGVQSVLVAMVEAPSCFSQEKSESFIDLLAKKLRESELIREVEYKSGEPKPRSLDKGLITYLPLILKKSDLKRLASKLSDAGIKEQIQKNKMLLMTPFGMAMKEGINADPLWLRDLLISILYTSSAKQPIGLYRGYYRTTDKRTYFLFIQPKKPPQDITFSKKLMAEVRDIERISLSELSEKYGDPAGGFMISYTGGYPIAISDEATTKRDIKITITTSFLGVLILFGLSFRRARSIFYVVAPLAISIIWTLGFARVVFHHLNILTCVFSAVLIGLGIDFAIHIFTRYFAQDEKGLDLPTRLKHTFQKTGGGIIIGGITTATAFYAIALSDFRAFRELGILTGTGILFCLVAMIFLLPSLLVYFSGKRGNGRDVSMASFGLEKLLGTIWKSPRALLTTSLVIICLLGIKGVKIGFDENLRNFRRADNDLLLLQERVTGWLGGSTGQVLLVVEGKSESDLMERNGSIHKALKELYSSGLISGVKSISDFLPSPDQQMINREFIKMHPEYFNLKRIRRTFNKALGENGFEIGNRYDEYFEALSSALLAEEILLPSSILDTEIGCMLRRFILGKSDSYSLVTYVIPKKDLWSRADTADLKDTIIRKLMDKGIEKDTYILTGANLLTGELKGIIIKNLQSSMWLAGSMVVLALLIYYRSLGLLALASLPLVVGLVALSGVMVLFHLDFNFLNIIVLPMIIGIGIDDGIHLVNTFTQAKHGDIIDATIKTGRAVVLTSLTTLGGFGSIALSHYPGLRSMGYVACIGIITCLFASIMVLPAIFSIISRRMRKSSV